VSSFRDRLLDEVPEWVEEGIVDEQQAQRILDRYPAEATSDTPTHASSTARDDEHGMRTFLYATAGVLIGAAAVAFVLVGLDRSPGAAERELLGSGLGLASLGLALHVFDARRDLFVDALLAASLVPLSTALGEGELAIVPVFAVGLPIAYLAWRWAHPFLPTLSVLGVSVAAALAIFLHADGLEAETTAWLLAQAALLVGLVGYDRWRSAGWTAPVALGVYGLSLAFVVYLVEEASLGSTGVELWVGGLLAAVLVAGLALRHDGLAIGASVGLGIDAIVFAFDVDELFGTFVLLLMAGLAIWQAEALKDWLDEAGPA
jgi:hypothetical protein